jgi:hypothetical protein
MNIEQFKDRCTEDGDCWIYRTDATTEHAKRYVSIIVNGRRVLARRLAWELGRGPIQSGRKIVPVCGNPCCVNPDHQKALTEEQKNKRAADRGAWSSPVRAKNIAIAKRLRGKLTPEIAALIRASDEPALVLAQRYGVSESLPARIKRGEAWKEYAASPFAGLGGRA